MGTRSNVDTTFTVACALVGEKWNPVWVYRLKQMLDRTNEGEFDFKVVTDRPDIFPRSWVVPISRDVVYTLDHHSAIGDTDKLVLNVNKPQGCWAKLDFFLDKFGDKPLLGLDLDICVLDDVKPLLRKGVHMPPDAPNHLNGSVYSFTPGHTGWTPPKKIPYVRWPRGEQEYVALCTGARPLPHCYSFKLNVASRPNKEPPPGTRIVFFHGMPTPADDKLQHIHWISRTWKGLERIERV